MDGRNGDTLSSENCRSGDTGGTRSQNRKNSKSGSSRNTGGGGSKMFHGSGANSGHAAYTKFGPTIPDDVLDDICFRFLINIPEDQVNEAFHCLI
ncbi:unnamed protein product [Gongylonema pulchrum]|uniref:F-box domain-containing protein n=1 Tax=Gongylonema pulchrum TaxID=637853 RepID=A0A183EV72_9BILA|nr:unnamed protein product [Gongylonema pulchrum]